MNNKQSLKEYLSTYRTIEEKRKVFFAIFRQIHRFHNNDEYIVNLSFDTIYVCYTNPTDIYFSKYEKIDNQSIDTNLNVKKQNILSLTQMMICIFLEYNFNNPLICLDILKTNLESVKKYLHQDDWNYYRSVLINDEFLYYDDYICKLDNKDAPDFTEKRFINENEEAFTNYLLLSINLVVVTLLFACLLMYLN